jgi:hypothetical protein
VTHVSYAKNARNSNGDMGPHLQPVRRAVRAVQRVLHHRRIVAMTRVPRVVRVLAPASHAGRHGAREAMGVISRNEGTIKSAKIRSSSLIRLEPEKR